MVLFTHAPLWYYCYFPVEFAVDTFRQKGKDFTRKKVTQKKSREEEDVAGKVVVITGANAGLGKQTAKEMAKRGAVVVMGCRNLERGEQARKEVMEETGSKTFELYRLDLCDFSSVRTFAAEVLQNHPVVDILINNGGIALNNTKQQLTKEGWDLEMTTNHLGHFLLTNLLLDAILASPISRIVAVSSTGCIPSALDVDDLMMTKTKKTGKFKMGWWSTNPYLNSKLANALHIKCLAQRYPSLKAYSVCPGLVRQTEIFNNYDKRFLLWMTVKAGLSTVGVDLEQGVDTILLCAAGKQVEKESGGFFRFGRRLWGVDKTLKGDSAEKLWKVSEEYVNFNEEDNERR